MSDRNELIDALDEAIDEAERKVKSGRVRDPQNEKVRQGWFRVLGYLAGQQRRLLEDRDLDELRERVDALENNESNYRFK
jgi:hypothetical protein